MNRAVTVTVGFQILFRQCPAKEGNQLTLLFRFGISLKNFFVRLQDVLTGETARSAECNAQCLSEMSSPLYFYLPL
jgi:hypothetical protein